MTAPKTYATPAAFKRALEDRVKAHALATRTTVNRARQLLIVDRLLGRIGREFGEAALTKGGIALELRLNEARTTKDLDIRLSNTVVCRRFLASAARGQTFRNFAVRACGGVPVLGCV